MQNKSHPAEMDFLLANIGHLHHLRAHQLLEGIGLYRGQPPVLFALWDQEGLTQTELCARLKISAATVTKMLQRMEKSGFIQRHPDTQDQRVTRVYLTDTGRAIRSQVEEIWKTMQANAFLNFTAEELDLMRLFLIRVRDNFLNATGEKPWDINA
jgi:DNA-binding MarR family transcriptional regulator